MKLLHFPVTNQQKSNVMEKEKEKNKKTRWKDSMPKKTITLMSSDNTDGLKASFGVKT